MSLPLPATLTPSKLTKFTSCPLAFRLSYIDRLPEAPSLHLVRGTIVHRALQILLTDGPPEDRTREQAERSLARAWDELRPGAIADLGLDLDLDGQGALRAEAAGLLESYFALEDPWQVHAIGVELDMRVEIDGIVFRGIVDRLDLRGDGDLVVDHKTGRAPGPHHERARMVGVHFYALVCEQLLGRALREVQLAYLRDPVVVAEAPTPQTLRHPPARRRRLASDRTLLRTRRLSPETVGTVQELLVPCALPDLRRESERGAARSQQFEPGCCRGRRDCRLALPDDAPEPGPCLRRPRGSGRGPLARSPLG